MRSNRGWRQQDTKVTCPGKASSWVFGENNVKAVNNFVHEKTKHSRNGIAPLRCVAFILHCSYAYPEWMERVSTTIGTTLQRRPLVIFKDFQLWVREGGTQVYIEW